MPRQLNLLQIEGEVVVGDEVRTPEGKGIVEKTWNPGDSTYMWDERSESIPNEPCLAVRYKFHTWSWFLRSECSKV